MFLCCFAAYIWICDRNTEGGVKIEMLFLYIAKDDLLRIIVLLTLHISKSTNPQTRNGGISSPRKEFRAINMLIQQFVYAFLSVCSTSNTCLKDHNYL